MSRLDPALVERFRNDLEALIGANPGKIGLAVSGGADSLAMLLLGHQALSGQIGVATVDHGLRAEAADEARFVGEICAARGILHSVLCPAEPITGSTQTAARAARYALLEAWADANGCDYIATAHHIDDQAETLLMRLNRGSGVAGLAGVRVVNQRIIRPVLGWRRAELAQVVEAAGIAAIDDPSNRNRRFDRVRVRQALVGVDWLDPAQLATSAALLAEANTALDWACHNLALKHLRLGVGRATLDPSLLPREIRRRLTVLALRHIEPEIEPRGPPLIELIEALGRGETRTLGGVLAKGGTTWRFASAPPRRST